MVLLPGASQETRGMLMGIPPGEDSGRSASRDIHLKDTQPMKSGRALGTEEQKVRRPGLPGLDTCPART